MERKSMINVRGTFSERNKIKNISKIMQIDEFDDRTRNRLQNVIYQILNTSFNKSCVNRFQDDYCMETLETYFNKFIIDKVLGECFQFDINTDYIPWNDRLFILNKIIKEAPYYEVLDLIESITNWLLEEFEPKVKNYPFLEKNLINQLFEQENVGYRFVDNQIVPMIDQVEIDAINDAVSCEFDSVKEHIHNAVTYLSDRENPNYAVCLTESITAVESICKIITNEDKFDLNQALKVLESKRELKGHLKNAFTSLYNYASDNARHGKKEPTNISFSTAKFSLVTCSAFVNYLISEYVELEDNK